MINPAALAGKPPALMSSDELTDVLCWTPPWVFGTDIEAVQRWLDDCVDEYNRRLSRLVTIEVKGIE